MFENGSWSFNTWKSTKVVQFFGKISHWTCSQFTSLMYHKLFLGVIDVKLSTHVFISEHIHI